jgi:hypothetical protein
VPPGHPAAGDRGLRNGCLGRHRWTIERTMSWLGGILRRAERGDYS